MRVLGMDLSKRSAGYAVWGPQDARVTFGVWELGSEITSQGRAFCRLHERMSDLHAVGPIDAVFWEEPLNLGPNHGFTNRETIDVLIGLAAHAASWAEAMGCRYARPVNMGVWRRRWIGQRGKKSKDDNLKDMATQAARRFGFKPRRHDEAEALGVLDWGCDFVGLQVPWRGALPLNVPERNPFEVPA